MLVKLKRLNMQNCFKTPKIFKKFVDLYSEYKIT